MKRVLFVLALGAILLLSGCAIGVRPAGHYSGGYYENRPVVVQPAPYYNNGYVTPYYGRQYYTQPPTVIHRFQYGGSFGGRSHQHHRQRNHHR